MSRVDLCEKVFAFTAEKRLFSAPCHVLLGLSGGADSMALLNVLWRWPQDGLKVTAVHIHHGLRGEAADRDLQFVRTACAEMGIPLVVKYVDVPTFVNEYHCSVEDGARRLRYNALEEVRLESGAEYILTAHTASDQAETVLMRMARGCGIDGLVGIQPARGTIRRPLLSCDRSDVEGYCEKLDIPFINDETNADTHFTRNFIRHELLPKLKQINPSVEEALFRLAEHTREEVVYLDTVAEKAAVAEKGCLCSLEPVIRRRLIRKALFGAGVPSIEEAHILAIEKAIGKGGQVDLPGGYTAHVYKGKLTVLHNTRESHPTNEPINVTSFPFEITLGELSATLEIVEKKETHSAQNVHKLFFNNQIDYDTIQGSLHLRSRRPGDRIRLAGRGVSKSVKKLMNEMEIPAHLRDTYPLLCDESGIVLIPDCTCAERVRVTSDTRHFLVWNNHKR